MDDKQRFSILTFPQSFDGTNLRVNIVFLPRNQNPLTTADGVPPPAGAPPFAEAKLSFVARIVSGLTGLPGTGTPLAPVPLTATHPANAKPLFEALAQQFHIPNPNAQNTDSAVKNNSPLPPRELDKSVKKYLPETYRKSFNFVAPRTPNAVTGDAYHCAVREAAPKSPPKQSGDAVNWGEVFANAMRQPLLATELGMIYQTQFTVNAADFAKGGWLYVELAGDSDYATQQRNVPAFIRHYAARIPVLEAGKKRSLFGAILFPVTSVPPPPTSNYDELFIEAADYDDGFAKIVHAFQPVSQNLLVEKSDGFHPTHEAGIRLGWDDEQILIWYIRQLAEESNGSGTRIDAPIGTFGYKIDVREDKHAPGAWSSLNQVSSKAALKVFNSKTNTAITLGDFTDRELPYQVYPVQLDGDDGKPFWLPMYFAAWTGKSMVLPDGDASAIYQHGKAEPRPEINVKGPPQNKLNTLYEPSGIATPLRYGTPYQFRIRLGDMSGGGPGLGAVPQDETPSQTTRCRFKRYVAPNAVRIDGLPANTSDFFTDTVLNLKRPILGYPAVVFTGKYADPIALLKAASDAEVVKPKPEERGAFGIADPDVESVEITVELQTLKMDNMMSVSGREAYIKYYTTARTFPKKSKEFDDTLRIKLDYRDCKVLNFGDPGNLGDLGVTQAEIDGQDDLVLPRARTIRLTLRAVCEAKPDYYGLEQLDHDFNTRFGRTIQFLLRADPLKDETGLLGAARQVRGIYLQPDPPFLFDGNIGSLLLGKEVERAPDIVQRLAQQLGVESKGMSLVGKKGQRVQFGCSQRIRHTLSPDNSSLTFASKGDLIHQWLCGIMLELERDWTWDGLEDHSLVITRAKRFREDARAETEVSEVGDIEIKHTAPFTALFDPDRSRTTLIFIDAVEPKNERMQPAPNGSEPRFPDLIDVEYKVEPAYKNPKGAPTDRPYMLPLELPITTPPAQIPKVISAGIALSPYQPHDNYSWTEPRRRFLWIEFEKPIDDPQDTYFARVLSNAPDQLISNNSPELLVTPEEPALPIDPEYIRVITVNQSNDDAGLDAMQPMEKSTGPGKDADRFYLLPLPAGLHPESPEMFGFFTYEIRVGHYRYTDKTSHHAVGDHVWTTAQGRFGRPLRLPGVQHPAPTLTCTVNRDFEKLYVTAPYAVAVHNGKNVTADPPRTEIWALLYAQVKQADNKEYRNILLDDRVLAVDMRVEHDTSVSWNAKYTLEERQLLQKASTRNFKGAISKLLPEPVFKLADLTTVNKDATKYGTAVWLDDEAVQLLQQYGLPVNSPLSVLCVEILPHITNIYDHVSSLHREEVRSRMRGMVGGEQFPTDRELQRGLAMKTVAARSVNFDEPRPLSNQLGQYRILRTSPLMKVPFVC